MLFRPDMKLHSAWLAAVALAAFAPHSCAAWDRGDGSSMRHPTVAEPDSEAAQGQYPFVVSLQWQPARGKRSRHICAGSLLSPVVVLTTAQCLAERIGTEDAGSRLVLVIDRSDLDDPLHGVERHPLRRSDGTARIFVHPGYKGEPTYDVAVIQLDEPVMVPVRPTVPPAGGTGLPIGEWMTAGWAAGESRLRRVGVTLLDDDLCRRRYGEVFDSDHLLCAGEEAGVVSCTDGGGSPLFSSGRNQRRPVQIGVAVPVPGCEGPGPHPYLKLDEPEVRAFLSRFVPVF